MPTSPWDEEAYIVGRITNIAKERSCKNLADFSFGLYFAFRVFKTVVAE